MKQAINVLIVLCGVVTYATNVLHVPGRSNYGYLLEVFRMKVTVALT